MQETHTHTSKPAAYAGLCLCVAHCTKTVVMFLHHICHRGSGMLSLLADTSLQRSIVVRWWQSCQRFILARTQQRRKERLRVRVIDPPGKPWHSHSLTSAQRSEGLGSTVELERTLCCYRAPWGSESGLSDLSRLEKPVKRIFMVSCTMLCM